jgi:outer membrane protein assembly factor BamA
VLLTSLTTLQSGILGEDIPIYADFHIGGTNTIRGWPLDARSGKNQFINTVEYRYLLTEPRPFSLSFFTAYIGLQLAAFGDFGHAWNETNDFAVNQFIGGYGVGLRVLIPFVDEIRMDVAWGAPGEGMTFHFGIYPKVVMQRQRVR